MWYQTLFIYWQIFLGNGFVFLLLIVSLLTSTSVDICSFHIFGWDFQNIFFLSVQCSTWAMTFLQASISVICALFSFYLFQTNHYEKCCKFKWQSCTNMHNMSWSLPIMCIAKDSIAIFTVKLNFSPPRCSKIAFVLQIFLSLNVKHFTFVFLSNWLLKMIRCSEHLLWG